MSNIYGHDIDLTALADDDGMVTDVLVLARTVRFSDQGRAEDALFISGTRSSTYMLQLGMLHAALESLGMEDLEDDE